MFLSNMIYHQKQKKKKILTFHLLIFKWVKCERMLNEYKKFNDHNLFSIRISLCCFQYVKAKRLRTTFEKHETLKMICREFKNCARHIAHTQVFAK